jgi:4a-hydroxytetrahydrobiopterin dehydratase
MVVQTPAELLNNGRLSRNGQLSLLSIEESLAQLTRLSGWRLTYDCQRIQKDWEVDDFMAGIDLVGRCAELIDVGTHHFDVHIEAFRYVSVVIYTRDINGLSDRDFTLAAKIDELPIYPQDARPIELITGSGPSQTTPSNAPSVSD